MTKVLFWGQDHTHFGGGNDFHRPVGSVEDAREFLLGKDKPGDWDWAHVMDFSVAGSKKLASFGSDQPWENFK